MPRKGPPALPDKTEDHYFSQKVESFSRLVFRRFRRHKLAIVGSCVMLALITVSLFAPILAPFPPNEMHLSEVVGGKPIAPGARFWLGTDNLGRDTLSRCMYGARVSLLVGFAATAISVAIGVLLGCLAGYYGGWVDMLVVRVIEILTCIPSFFLLIALNVLLGASTRNVILILGFLGWMGIARQIRAQFLSLREQEFVQAARALGLRDGAIAFRHLLPNALTPVIVAATMGIAGNIMAESGLSYFGFGIKEPTASWGSMLKQAMQYMREAPWLAIFPGLLISLTALALNFIGDGLRDALDPRTLK